MVLDKKWPFFQLFFQAIQARKTLFTIFQNKNTIFYAIKTRSSKIRKIKTFPKGLTHAVSPKNGHFSNFFFFGNIGQENVFYDILERKKKRLTYGFCRKIAIFPTFFFGNIGHKNVFYDILKRKNDFLCHKNNKFRKSKN